MQKQVENARAFGVPVVVAVNAFKWVPLVVLISANSFLQYQKLMMQAKQTDLRRSEFCLPCCVAMQD